MLTEEICQQYEREWKEGEGKAMAAMDLYWAATKENNARASAFRDAHGLDRRDGILYQIAEWRRKNKA